MVYIFLSFYSYDISDVFVLAKEVLFALENADDVDLDLFSLNCRK